MNSEQQPDEPDDRIPDTTVEWVAGPGDARRATLSVIRSRRLWRRTLLLAVVVGLVAATICIATGSGWLLGAAIGGGFFALVAVELPIVALVCAWLQNRRVLRPGARWAAGSNATRIRIDSPVNTIVLERANLESVQPAWAMVLLTVRPAQHFAVPAPLFSGLLTDPGLRVTADDLML
ncbi:hypothetical protein AXK57_21125 [Tsukamurella pulmonis]|uniref:YcxB-like protein n=1 Tax=Tsukamurella pulmonis TaxID=47312 RepID=A0A1H1HUE1_9ACTN|nr:hypothetical protein [Tsukamurella pulmonis]KXO94359.1 hypothetical protein AXK56_16985 [Tsukamurella pulmonis]KXP11758.1 hypothetical protein AXK57_21125 [Tsukamurella pulmonis]RDH12673.1 hypothetical protein DVB88_06360 [Tsukamurella pulmonis]SDR29075.1 hypothetical protein SAMN04489765_4608 [Tsukamurella pulmonis]SUP13103.1 Uncharacterised protein [Tsukamurella pulmonis]